MYFPSWSFLSFKTHPEIHENILNSYLGALAVGDVSSWICFDFALFFVPSSRASSTSFLRGRSYTRYSYLRSCFSSMASSDLGDLALGEHRWDGSPCVARSVLLLPPADHVQSWSQLSRLKFLTSSTQSLGSLVSEELRTALDLLRS